MLVLLAVVAVIVRETTASAAHVEPSKRAEVLREQIASVESENVSLAARVEVARSVESIRETAKRDLGLVDPHDRAIVILSDLRDPPTARTSTFVPAATVRSEPVEFGHLGAWLDLFFGDGAR